MKYAIPFFLFSLSIVGIYSCKSNETAEVIENDMPPTEKVLITTDDGERKVVTRDYIPGREAPDGRVKRMSREGAVAEEAVMMTDAEYKSSRESEPAAPVAMAESRAMESRGDMTTTRPGQNQIQGPGQITAGEWNDLNNWDDWKQLLENSDYSEMQQYWKTYPTQRYTVFVYNEDEAPVQDTRVDLLNHQGEAVWSARTDNSGKAELWADWGGRKNKMAEQYSAKIYHGKKATTIDQVQRIEDGVNRIEINERCRENNKVDVFFAVDATGSMGDEINYLQAELQDVIKRSLMNNDFDVRLGATFYRDTTDQYLTRTQPLSRDPERTIKFIGEQSAQGGGDYPEAVDAALEEVMLQEWREDAIARIVFLLLDAPPHYNDGVMNRLKDQVKEAAELGIKIIPITASGINRETEFLMKFLALGTNGTYVFITDDSGIGNDHLEPVAQDYEVEKLNDLMVRLLSNYTKSNGCSNNSKKEKSFTYYPNPASNFVTVEVPEGVTSVRLLSNSGMLIWKSDVLESRALKIQLADYVDGIYTIQCTGENYNVSQPLIVVSG